MLGARLPRQQLLAAVVLGVAGGIYIFQPYFKKIGEERRQAATGRNLKTPQEAAPKNS